MTFEFDLPEEIIQRIQYFLNEIDCSGSNLHTKETMSKEAVQTCILNKAWYSAWSTRPNLILAHEFGSLLPRPPKPRNDFPTFARKTIQRYKNLNMRIHTLVLALKPRHGKQGYKKLADELIADSLNSGLNELHVNINPPCASYTLPTQVLETTTLTKLCIRECDIINTGGRTLLCSRLVSLTLWNVSIDYDLMNDILSQCTSIKNLKLSIPSVYGEYMDFSRLQNLVNLHVKCIKLLSVRFMKSGSGIDAPHYHNMSSIRLHDVNVDGFFFTHFSSLFPCVENLYFHDSDGYEDIQISSQTLKYLELDQGREFKKVRLEVPNIRKLTFKVECFPSLSVICSKSEDWETHIEWNQSGELKPFTIPNPTAEVAQVSNFLAQLSGSKIFIYICLAHVVFKEDVACSPIPPAVVENLKVYVKSSPMNPDSLLGSLFRTCRPRFVTLGKYNYTKMCRHGVSLLPELITDTWIIQNKDKYNNQRNKPMDLNPVLQSLFLRHGLEEVSVELFNKHIGEWETCPLGDSFDSLSVKLKHIKWKLVRFHFRWKGVGEPELASPADAHQFTSVGC